MDGRAAARALPARVRSHTHANDLLPLGNPLLLRCDQCDNGSVVATTLFFSASNPMMADPTHQRLPQNRGKERAGRGLKGDAMSPNKRMRKRGSRHVCHSEVPPSGTAHQHEARANATKRASARVCANKPRLAGPRPNATAPDSSLNRPQEGACNWRIASPASAPRSLLRRRKTWPPMVPARGDSVAP